jgi:uncharacterized protein (DUF1330 family)
MPSGTSSSIQLVDMTFGMVAYMVAHLKINDTEWLESEYVRVTAAIEAKHRGVHIAFGQHAQVEGDDAGVVTSIPQFPTTEHAWAFWNDPEYQRVVPLRQAGSDTTVVIIDGAEAPAPFAQSSTAPT